jgi:Tfp pilus assembly protein PilV
MWTLQMSDACFVGVWHRYVLRRAGARDGSAADAGITLVEILVAIILLSVALIGTAGEIAAYIKQQVIEKSQISANHLADSWFEYAESVANNTAYTTAAPEATGGSNGNLAPVSTTNTTTAVVNGVTYTEQMTPHICTANQVQTNAALSACTAGGAESAGETIYSTIHITWKLGDTAHQLTMTRNLADNSIYNPGDTHGSAANALAHCTRANQSATGVLSFSVSNGPGPTAPLPIDLDSGNHPVLSGNLITVTLNTTGLVNTVDPAQIGTTNFGPADCVPLQWTDDTGTHQVDMHTTASACTGSYTAAAYGGTSCSYTATVPTSAVTKSASYPSWSTFVTFNALLIDAAPTQSPPITAVTVSKNFYLDAPPSFGACNVQSAGSLLGFILGINNVVVSQVNNFTGGGTNMGPGTQITVTYTPQTGTANAFTFLMSTNTTAWTQSGTTSSVTYTVSVGKNLIIPVPKNSFGVNALGVLIGGTANSFSYSAIRNDGKTTTCSQTPSPVPVRVFS